MVQNIASGSSKSPSTRSIRVLLFAERTLSHDHFINDLVLSLMIVDTLSRSSAVFPPLSEILWGGCQHV